MIVSSYLWKGHCGMIAVVCWDPAATFHSGFIVRFDIFRFRVNLWFQLRFGISMKESLDILLNLEMKEESIFMASSFSALVKERADPAMDVIRLATVGDVEIYLLFYSLSKLYP
ncbi:hypothetical protein CEXT_650661 [Caerostris extrusa]|uniref:Uncharacterized protein n=1 Tax=Caerostris extrusa TaxID=172846 RepID=A0AAV4NVR2_CAEEX|nr:hypothetical protein CEXT_650661 [Caerostris extrusa]